MNIVLYTNSFLPAVGGREVVVHYLSREFHRLGHRVRVLGPAGWLAQRKYKFSYPVHRWPTLRHVKPEQVWGIQLKLDLMLFGADIIHAHSTYPCGYIASKLNKKKAIPLVITPHGEDIHMIPEIGFGLRLDPIKNKLIKKALDRAHFLTAISDSIRNSLLSAGASAAKIVNIPNGIDIKRFQNDFANITRRKLGIEENCRIILSVGNYHKRKGHEVMIKAMPTVLRRHPNARLVIVGRNPDPLKKILQEFCLENKVILTGPIPFRLADYRDPAGSKSEMDLLAALYRICDIYVSASMGEGAEGLSLALLDAMGAGNAIVATDVSGNRDLITDRQTGLLVPPNDEMAIGRAVSEILNDQMLRCRLKVNARKLAEQYSWKSIAKRYIDLYRNAIVNNKSKL